MPETTTQQDRIERAAAHLRQVITMLQELDREQGEDRSNGFRWTLTGARGVASRLSTVGESVGLDVTSLADMQRRMDRVQRPGHDPAGPVVLPEPQRARIEGTGPDCTCGPEDILHVAGCARGSWLLGEALRSDGFSNRCLSETHPCGHAVHEDPRTWVHGNTAAARREYDARAEAVRSSILAANARLNAEDVPGPAMAARSAGSRHPRRVSGRASTATRAARSAVPTFDVFETDNGPGGMSWELHRRRVFGDTSAGQSWLASCDSEDDALRRAYAANGQEPCRVAVFTHATWEARQETDEEGSAANPDRIVAVPR